MEQRSSPHMALAYLQQKEIQAVDTCMVHANDNIIMVSHWSKYDNPSIKDIHTQEVISPSISDLEEYEEELYQRCVELVTKARKGSTGLLQRRLSTGYGRAAKMLATWEKRCTVPMEGVFFVLIFPFFATILKNLWDT